MADKQKLEDAAVIQLQKQMSEKYEGIRKRVHSLQGVIDGLEGQWQGIGRAAFDKKQYEINESLKNIGDILGDVIEAMTATRNIKDSKEDEVRSSVNKIDVRDGASSMPSSALSSY
ncbi:WXG100 family type VII secretion target [Streptomyces sp. J2-1]|uniref:WXG100 family type VII secretion target n=1 Tax=Streptomyces corallincola TaxID=2851888 RepID=UPI001C3950A8|nr:WXG100 family type VII secretion target [Streptomyces corallincola]MBV2353573.1 WXG100 family type VII secretion target [Streptomyces corallincola]